MESSDDEDEDNDVKMEEEGEEGERDSDDSEDSSGEDSDSDKSFNALGLFGPDGQWVELVGVASVYVVDIKMELQDQ